MQLKGTELWMVFLNYDFIEHNLKSSKVDTARIQISQAEFLDTDFHRVENNRLALKSETASEAYVLQQLKIAEKAGTHLLLFPELSIPLQVIPKIEAWSSGQNCIVVAGTHYEKDPVDGQDISVCPIIFEGKTYTQHKCKVAPSEKSAIKDSSVKGSSEFPIFRNTPIGDFANFICADYLNSGLKTRVLERNLDVVSIVAFQGKSRTYHERINSDVEDTEDGVYIAYCNSRVEPIADGESSLFAIIDRKLFSQSLIDSQITRPDFLNMVCNFGPGNQHICDVDLKKKRPSIGRTESTKPNVSITSVEKFYEKSSEGQVVPQGETTETSTPLASGDFASSAYLLAQIHNALDAFREDLRARQATDLQSLDAHSVASDFAVRLSQSVYYNNGSIAIFKSDKSRTNIQRAELLSLLTSHTIAAQHDDLISLNVPLQFFSTSELRESLADTWVSLVPDRETFTRFVDDDEVYQSVGNTILSAFFSLAVYSVVVDFFECSAAIFPAPGLAVDFETLLRQSGYIHSIGKTIYLRNVRKTSVMEIQHNLAEHIFNEVPVDDDSKVPFCLYCNEIFDDYQTRGENEDIAGGIENLKFRSEKFFFGGRPIYSFRDALLRDPIISEKVEFIGSGSSYREQISQINNRHPGTIWLYRDQKRGETDENFFICYHQTIVNADTFLQADEDKPAWLGPVTLPQSLASAMLSLTRPYFDLSDSPVIIDPFLGSGTTLFEAFKMFNAPDFWGGDINPATKQAVFDNATLLAGESDIISKVLDSIENLLTGKDQKLSVKQFSENYGAFIQGGMSAFELAGATRDVAAEVFQKCHLFVAGKISENQNTQGAGLDPHRAVRALSSSSVDEIFSKFEGKPDIYQRILIYCYWKATLRNSSAFLEKRRKVPDKVFQELKNFLLFMRRVENGTRTRQVTPEGVEIPALLFSDGVSPDTSQLNEFLRTKQDQLICGEQNGNLSQFFQSLPDNVRIRGADIIITDPPYGFNTDHEGAADLFKLYDILIEEIVAIVGSQTHLLICLPEESHNGQTLPSFVTKSWFLPRLLQQAASKRVEVIEHSKVWPGSANSGKAPYYWRSERALTRSVLHVILRRIRVEGEVPK